MKITSKEWQKYFSFWEKESLRVQNLVKSTQYGKIGWKVIHQRKIKDYIKKWVQYFNYLDNNPKASESTVLQATGIHWRGTMYMRYLGMITKNKKMTPPAKRFYLNPSLQNSIFQQQLEKWYYCVDDFFRSGDKTYNVFPFFVLLKILVEVGKSNNDNYSINIDEFRYFVLTTKEYGDYRIAADFILAYRDNPMSFKSALDDIFSNTSYDRILFLLELSDILKITSTNISIKSPYLKIAIDKLNAYEELERKKIVPHYHNDKLRYFKMLYSDESIFEFCESEPYIDTVVNDIIKFEHKEEISEEEENELEKKIDKYRKKLTADQLKERIKRILQRRQFLLPNSLKKKYRRQTVISDKESIKIERTIGKLLANYYACCQIIGCGYSFSKGKDGSKGNYCEAHHLQNLADNGKDVPENIVVLCANHHRQFHYDDAKIIKRDKKVLTVGLSGKQYKVNIDYSF